VGPVIFADIDFKFGFVLVLEIQLKEFSIGDRIAQAPKSIQGSDGNWILSTGQVMLPGLERS